MQKESPRPEHDLQNIKWNNYSFHEGSMEKTDSSLMNPLHSQCRTVLWGPISNIDHAKGGVKNSRLGRFSFPLYIAQ